MHEVKTPAYPSPAEASDSSSLVPHPVVESSPAVIPAEPWERVRELALQRLDRFVSLELKVLAGDDPDAIHDMRVASRRLQQVLDLLYPAPRAPEIRRLRRKIRRCRRALGEVRNCDVLLDQVERSLGRKRTSRRESWIAVQQYLRQRRAQNFQKAVRKLSKLNLAVLYLRLKGWLSANGDMPGLGHPPQEESSAANLYDRVHHDLDKFWEAFETKVAESQHDPRSHLIHAVRIATKRLRYLIELIHTFEVQGSPRALAWLRAVQQHLGDWHDLEILEGMMIEMVARPEFLRDHLELAVGVENLILSQRGIKRNFADKYFGMTQASMEFEWMKEWVGYLLASPPAAFNKGG